MPCINFWKNAFPIPTLAVASLILSGCAGDPSAGSGAETWSLPKRAAVGKNFPNAHGIFNAEPVSVTIRDLPAHACVKVKFNLLITGGWDGSNVAWGPDIWAMRVRGGEQLMMTTFSNIGAKTSYYIQAYPDDFPWGVHYAFTGATPVSGKPFERPDPRTDVAIADACYPVEIMIPHKAAELTLDFLPVYDDAASDSQHWAISDFELAPAAAPQPPDDVELFRLWDELAANDSVRANAAMWKLLSGGDKAEAFLIAKAKSVEGPDSSLVNKPEGLRIHRLQKVLRIMGSPKAQSASTGLTYLIPEYGGGTPRVSP